MGDVCIPTLDGISRGVIVGIPLSGGSAPITAALSAMESLLSTKRGEKETASETGIIVGLEVH